jgi:DNA relaxase NicK
MTHSAFQRWDEFLAKQTQNYQPRITDFARPADDFAGILGPSSLKLAPTDRVQKALEKLKKKNSTELNEKEENGGDKIKSSKITTKIGSKNIRKRKQRRGRPAVKKTKTISNQKFTLSEESSSSSD